MKKTLAELWEETGGPTVQYEGQTVHGVVFKQVKRPGRLTVRFLSSVEKPVQALRIDIDAGQLCVDETESEKMILRLDTCPQVSVVHYMPSSLGSRLTFYNAWINEDGGVDAWMMHSGMLVEEAGNKMILRCSDGRGEPNFQDLVVEIEFLDD